MGTPTRRRSRLKRDSLRNASSRYAFSNLTRFEGIVNKGVVDNRRSFRRRSNATFGFVEVVHRENPADRPAIFGVRFVAYT
jgi:hypothetical protein